MKPSVLQKPIEYANCKIYVRNTDELWEYFTIIKGELYTAYIIAKKKPFQRNYTDKQIHDITQYMFALAETTIDTVLGIVH